jgi:hypothetical protein
MPGFTSRDDIINEMTTNGKRQQWNFFKTAPAAAEAVGAYQSLWKGVGNPGAGADPATTPGTVYTSDPTTPVNGSMFFADVSTDLRYLLSFGAAATQNCSLILYDRLAGVSGIAVSSTGSKTVNSGALTRYSGTAAVNNEAWLEVTTATTTTAPIVNLNSYTSADGTTGLTGGSVTFPATATDIHTLVPLPLAAGEQGVRSVEAGLNVGTAGATGICNLIIINRLATIPLIANQWNEVNFLDDSLGLPPIFDNATLGLAILAGATTAINVIGSVTCVYG